MPGKYSLLAVFGVAIFSTIEGVMLSPHAKLLFQGKEVSFSSFLLEVLGTSVLLMFYSLSFLGLIEVAFGWKWGKSLKFNFDEKSNPNVINGVAKALIAPTFILLKMMLTK